MQHKPPPGFVDLHTVTSNASEGKSTRSVIGVVVDIMPPKTTRTGGA